MASHTLLRMITCIAFASPLRVMCAQAMYETEALLDHLFFHPNTAPFITHRLIQRLTTSNPSPKYVKAVSTAFSTGAVPDTLK